MDEPPTPVARMLPFPSTSPPSTAASLVAADRQRQRTAADPSTAQTSRPVPAAHGADLSALLALQPTRPSDLTVLPWEVQAEILQYLTPHQIGPYADAFEPSVVPAPERAAAALSVRIEAARSLRQMEICLDEAIALDPAVRCRPILQVLCRMKTSRHWWETPGEKRRVEARMNQCLEVARQMSRPQASRVVGACAVLRFFLGTVGSGDASDLAMRVLAEVPAMPAGDRPQALCASLAFVDNQMQMHQGPSQALPARQLHRVVNACLEQADHLPLRQREDLLHHVSRLVYAWRGHTGRPWVEVEQPLLAHLARLPVASLLDAITPAGSIFERLVTILLGARAADERGAFLDQLIGAVPRDPHVRSECLTNIATLLPLIPPSQWLARFANIAVTAATLPRDEPDRRQVLVQLRGDLIRTRLPPEHLAAAMGLLAQQAPLVFPAPDEVREFLEILRRMLCLVAPELREGLEQTIARLQPPRPSQHSQHSQHSQLS